MNETCAVCGKPFEWGQRITCADGEPRHGGCNPGQIERERQDLLGADPERQALADAWGAWVREGRIRGWTQGHAEIVYRAFAAAWAAGSDWRDAATREHMDRWQRGGRWSRCARSSAGDRYDVPDGGTPAEATPLSPELAAAYDAGVAAEREACARLAEQQRFIHFAGMIRARHD